MSYANDSTDTTGVKSCEKSLQILTFEKRLLHFNKYSRGALGRFNPTVLLQAIKRPHQFNPAKYISPTVSPAGMN